MKIFRLFLLLLIASMPICGAEPKSYMQEHRDEIDTLLNKLLPVQITKRKQIIVQGPSLETQTMVPVRLLQIASESAQSRSEVIAALIQVLENPPSKEESLIAHRWTTAVSVLGDLRSTEAIDILVKNLDQTGQNGIIISLHYRPVASAIANIGEPAVPRLVEALADENPHIRREASQTLVRIGQPALIKLKEALYNGDAETKGGAALAMAWIGGEDAKTTIEHAIEVETDQEALSKLKDALKEMHRRWGN